MLMEKEIIYLALVLCGLCFGSFAGALTWRLRARQLKQDKSSGDLDKSDMHEYNQLKKLTKASAINDRSQCLNCAYNLKWYDLIPLLSWVSLGGKCRKCRKPIGYLEPLIELSVATFFVLSYVFWPYQLLSVLEISRFVLWLAAGVGLAALFVYDAKWFLLPDKLNFTVIGIGFVSAVLVVIGAIDKANALFEIAGSTMILSGIYYILYQLSKGKWIGFGDIKLGLGLAFLLSDWKLAFVALFAANLFGCLFVIPGMISGKLKRNSHVPFGPMLIAGFVFAGLLGSYIVNLYISILI